MILIVNSDEEEAAAWRAVEVINSLRRREVRSLTTTMDDSPWVKTRRANEKYL
jgi:hypothetical protein